MLAWLLCTLCELQQGMDTGHMFVTLLKSQPLIGLNTHHGFALWPVPYKASMGQHKYI